MLPPKAFMLHSLMEDRDLGASCKWGQEHRERKRYSIYRPPLFLEMNVNSINILRHKKE